jgi:alkanesulfonate monooxygenase SsuD/methylene tetrahydromethanopterin reductase-like flavin-dependent oxidoreductase (luciferase family)
MRIGLILGIGDEGGEATPRWPDLAAQAGAAEDVGFDLLALADALTEGSSNFWEGMTMAGALAAATDGIGLTHSVVNAPLRPPALVARAAHTLDEVSGGRYTLGIGAGNTPDDYRMFGIDADPRYARFEESLTVIHALLRDRAVDVDGRFQTAHADRFGPSGPRPTGIPINVAAGGPKMLALTARLADEWNWWAGANGQTEHLPPILEALHGACVEAGRGPKGLRRTLDLYSYDPLGIVDDAPPHVLSGPPGRIAESLLALGEWGIDEVRVDVAVVPVGRRIEAIEALAPVVTALHRG